MQPVNATKACPHNPAVSCNNCRLSGICLPLALESDEIVRLDNIVQRGRPLQKSHHLFREGDVFTSVYAVRSGAEQTYSITDAGDEQVTGFYFPGEVVEIVEVVLGSNRRAGERSDDECSDQPRTQSTRGPSRGGAA